MENLIRTNVVIPQTEHRTQVGEEFMAADKKILYKRRIYLIVPPITHYKRFHLASFYFPFLHHKDQNSSIRESEQGAGSVKGHCFVLDFPAIYRRVELALYQILICFCWMSHEDRGGQGGQG